MKIGPLWLSLLLALSAPACDSNDDDGGNDDDDGGGGPTHILFGDLHTHSSFSLDAALESIPLLSGNGYKSPEVMCDFARFCSQLDFWAMTDHPEQMANELWPKTKQMVRECNELGGGYSDDPDMVTYLGWEWTQTSEDPSNDWNHKNVIFLDTEEEKVPTRAISAGNQAVNVTADLISGGLDIIKSVDPDNAELYDQVGGMAVEAYETPRCEKGVDVRDLSLDCHEEADDPAELYEKLDQWGFPTLVIPHGSSWGAQNALGAKWDYQLNRRHHRPEYERLVEIYSGHGNSEEYRDWSGVVEDETGKRICPEPSEGYTPCCWRVGEVIEERADECADDKGSDACRTRVADARQAFIDADRVDRYYQYPEMEWKDWADCSQCTDCFQPAYLYRAGFTVQAALGLTDFEIPDDPFRYHWGIIGSTDTHRTGPGTGYKEFDEMTDTYGPAHPDHDGLFNIIQPALFPEWERQSAYWYSGGLVAVHADGRDRQSIWDALMSRNVYGTSGERILLWFDLENPPGDQPVTMGDRAAMVEAPRFSMRAVGAFKQKEGCPETISDQAPEGFIRDYCFGECYNPSDERYSISRFEVVKIQPQISPDEKLADLIQDPYRTLPCDPNPEGCAATFEEDDYDPTRPATYYVRAIQEPTPQFNAADLRCTRDASGKCVDIDPCLAGYRITGDCLAPDEERAWSSPIYIDSQ